jgi:hypothetical protein
LPVMLVFSPWLIKNLIATGNPVYPLLFPGGAMSPLRLLYFQGGRPWGNWLDVLVLPARATLWGAEGAPGYSASIGPLLLGLGLAAGLGWKNREPAERSFIGLAAQLGLTAIVVWAFVGRFSIYLLQSRLYLTIFPALTVLAAAGYSGLADLVQNGVRFRVIIGTLLILVLGLNAVEVGIDTVDSRPAANILGLTSSEQYLSENLGWYAPAMESLKQLPQGSRVLLLFEPRSYYCLPVCDPDEVLDRWLRSRHEGLSGTPESADQIIENWKKSGYTHLLFYRSGADFLRNEDPKYTSEDWRVLQETLARLDQTASFGESYFLYRLNR